MKTNEILTLIIGIFMTVLIMLAFLVRPMAMDLIKYQEILEVCQKPLARDKFCEIVAQPKVEK